MEKTEKVWYSKYSPSGSDIGKTVEKLSPCLKGAPEIVDAKVLRAESEIADWADRVLREAD